MKRSVRGNPIFPFHVCRTGTGTDRGAAGGNDFADQKGKAAYAASMEGACDCRGWCHHWLSFALNLGDDKASCFTWRGDYSDSATCYSRISRDSGSGGAIPPVLGGQRERESGSPDLCDGRRVGSEPLSFSTVAVAILVVIIVAQGRRAPVRQKIGQSI